MEIHCFQARISGCKAYFCYMLAGVWISLQVTYLLWVSAFFSLEALIIVSYFGGFKKVKGVYMHIYILKCA